MRILGRLALVAGAILSVGAGAVSAQAPATSTSTQTRQFEIVSVDGNTVVVKGEQGYREITVADDFRLSVDGRAVSVRELKPGMKGTATITTTTTSTPVAVTQVRDGVVMQKTGNSIVVRTAEGVKMFSEADVARRGVRIMRDGAPLAFTDLNVGDKLTATIVTTQPPKIMTQQQVAASMSSAPAAAGPPPEAPTRTAAATPAAPAASAEPRQLPKTASLLPLIALVGAGSTMLGLTLTLWRRRSA